MSTIVWSSGGDFVGGQVCRAVRKQVSPNSQWVNTPWRAATVRLRYLAYALGVEPGDEGAIVLTLILSQLRTRLLIAACATRFRVDSNRYLES